MQPYGEGQPASANAFAVEVFGMYGTRVPTRACIAPVEGLSHPGPLLIAALLYVLDRTIRLSMKCQDQWVALSVWTTSSTSTGWRPF